ncbi:AAA family ATPase [Natrinema salaciae]|uniref:AAA+-type ATPase, SpoVK/Ycf46/Vps4 family n=1 Tax=Natrinema salaciae TaxID=1186196 RepID=A0A1H9MFD2_9EURY|nr:AAA family ATPase [Natrinema salaciae]SER22358.1 AAA+-type ATPase, SpoVK/Ycf46/Vps4 family [Natrinema salaciae]
MVSLLTPAQAGGWSAFVPGSSAFLTAVVVFGTLAVVLRTVSWMATTQLDRLLLGLAYVVGVVGFVVTRDLALVFAPPTATLVWLFVTERTDVAPVGSGSPSGGGDDGSEAGDGDDTALDADQLDTDPPGHDFSDVGGMDALTETIRDRVIDPLTRPDVYDHYGIGAVNGVLFHGPPGCGKTFVASAVAAETAYNYIEVTPTDVTSKYIGEAADNVATVFEAARENEPCLVFIDEIDAIAGDRSERMATSEQQMVNQLLTELETQDDSEIVVFAATNYLEDVDDAILRSGRFDERIEVPPPDRRARLEILDLELADAPVADNVSLEAIADATAGYASSDVTVLADVAIRHAIADETSVRQSHLRQAVDEIDTSIPGWLDRYEDRFDEDLGRSSTEEPVSFDDLPGMDDLTAAIERRVFDPIRNADGYERYGVTPVDGALLYGPPDAGKTTLARSIAAELDRPTVEISPDRFRREAVDDPADRAAEIIEDARSIAPSVLVLDDLDELAPASGGSRATRQVATRLETLLPTLEDDVLVVGTARAIDRVHIDVLHAGTFDERIEVPPPDARTRGAVLDDALPGGIVAEDVDLATVADATEGFSIRDVRHLAGRVGREAVRREEQITTERLVAEADAVEATLEGWDGPQFDGLPSSIAPDGGGRPR